MTIKGSRRRSATMKALKVMMNGSARVARNLALAGLGLATLSLVLVCVPGAAAELPAGLELRFELAPAAPLAVPPLPPAGVFPVQLVLDDDASEGTVGVSDGSGAREFLWFNRFTPAGEPFDLAEVWVLFPAGPNIAPGDAVQIAVYLDPDGDPTNGADLLATFAETVQVADGNTFSVYPLAPAVPIHEPGDVLIGVVPRFIDPGDPPTAPAAIDTTASQGRSWIAIWSGDPPEPPELPPDLLLGLIDDIAPAAAGNWMIRGFGVPAPVVVIPALDGPGLALLALVLGAAGLVALRRRHRRAARILGLIALAAAAALTAAPVSAQVVIDEFTTDQPTVTDPPGGGSTAVTGGADILGGKRGLRVRNLAGPGPTSIGVSGGALDFAVAATTPDSFGEADVIWDGDADNDPATFDPTGFGTPVDLTDGGTQGAIRITVEQAQAGTHLLLTIYEDAGQVSRAGRVLPAIASTTDVFISFSELIAHPSALGPADLTQVGAITLRIGGSESASPPVLSISHLETAGPNVAAAKVDTVGGVIVTDPQTPGTTLRYRVTIENPGAGAAEGVDFDDVITDPNLGPPSAIRTTPLARRDQYITFTDGPIDSAGDGVPSLLDNDVDLDGNPLATVADPGQATAQGGTVVIGTGGHFVYTPPAGFVGVDAFNYTVAATAGDPTADAAGNPIGPIQSIAYVAIDRVPPVITAGGTLLYTENDGPQPIDPALTVVDVDSVNLFGATAAITANYVMGEDVLGFVNTANITGVFVPGTGVLTLTGTDTVAAYQAALRSVTYENTSEDPSELDRTVTWTATDGGETSAPATSTIEVTSVNDLPIVTTSAGSTNFTEDGGPVVVDSAVTVTDADDTSLASATVTITNLLDAGLETLAANTGGTSIVALYAAPTLTLTGPDTVANFQQVLQSVTYENASQDPNVTDRIVRFVAHDGTDPSAPADKTVTITPQNDPPVAGDDTWQTIGNTRLVVDLPALSTPHVLAATGSGFGVLDNDADPAENDNIAVSAIVGCADVTPPFGDSPACVTANGGTVLMNANGTFTYTPAAGDAAASDTFQYVVTDDGVPAPASDTGTVTIQRVERVWYVDNEAAAGGLGRSHDPFDTLVEAQTASVANDWIFVYFGDGTAGGHAAGIVLKGGQHLLGEHAGLSIPVGLNGNPSPTVLHAGTPGSRPLIDRSGAGNHAVSATDAIPAEIAGVSLLSAGGDAIDVTTNPAFAGSGTLSIRDVVVRGAATEGIDVNHGGSGAVTLAVHDNTVTAGGRGIDVARTGGSMTITRFDDNVISGNTGGSGIEVAGALFDAIPGLPVQQVAGGVTLIGQSGNGVGTNGLLLTNVTGDLGFTNLNVFNDSGTGLRATSTGALNAGAGTGFRIVLPAGVATIDSNGGPAVDVNNASVTLPLGFMESTNSTTTGLSLVNAFGGAGQTALSVSSGAISDPGGASGNAVTIDGGTGNVTLGIPITNNSGRAVSIANRTGDTVAFTGAIAETGTGLSMTNNGGATISYRGGLTASTGANGAFSATGGGNLEVCDENPCNPGATGGLVNTLATTTATALNVANTTISANRLEFRSITSNGGTNGIVLNTTGALGGLSVKGTGGAGTGGTIQNKTGPGILLTSTSSVNLASMIVTAGGDDGIRGSSVTGLSLSGVQVTSNGNAAGEAGIELTNLLGTSTWTNTTVSGSAEDNVVIRNNTGTMNGLTVTGSTFSNNSAIGNDGFLVEATGTATMTVSITGSNFTAHRGDHFQGAAANSGVLDVVFSSNILAGGHATALGQGITISAATGVPGFAGTVDYNVDNNTINGSILSAITANLGTSAAGSNMRGTISGNFIGTAGSFQSGSTQASGITVEAHGNGTHTTSVTNNTIRQTFDRGINVLANDGGGTLNMTVTGNDSAHSDGVNSREGFFLNNGSADPNIFGLPDSHFVCLTLGGAGALRNTLTHGPGAPDDFRLRQRFNSTIRLPGYAGAATDTVAVVNFVNGNNLSTTGSATVNSPPGGGFVGGAACPLPP